MSNRQTSEAPVRELMRPNIRISHAKNGRVKDFAAEHDLSTSNAYSVVIDAGLEAVEEADEEELEELLDGVESKENEK